MTRRHLARLALPAAALLALAGCGDSGGGESAESATATMAAGDTGENTGEVLTLEDGHLSVWLSPGVSL